MATAAVSELRIEDLDHLGIIAGVIDRIGLVEGVNDRLGTSPDEIITTGQILKADDPKRPRTDSSGRIRQCTPVPVLELFSG
ncbi:MAG: DUF4277 domain-containing protein [Truepera sp.]|nr:DUF4277 domain-containing protein [Truepera sp.]